LDYIASYLVLTLTSLAALLDILHLPPPARRGEEARCQYKHERGYVRPRSTCALYISSFANCEIRFRRDFQ
jgi:hypothetical protein